MSVKQVSSKLGVVVETVSVLYFQGRNIFLSSLCFIYVKNYIVYYIKCEACSKVDHRQSNPFDCLCLDTYD